METSPELLKDFADRLARVAVTPDGRLATGMLRMAGLLAQPPTPAPEQSLTDNIGNRQRRRETSDGPPSPLRVGIWEGKEKNGRTYFTRRMDKSGEWNLWANVGRIDPKGARRRVVLVGESVARGYLYDPQFTVAKALEMILRSRMGKESVEVIDLARTNLGYEVTELAESALLLEPDVVIIFAGNNLNAPFVPTDYEVPVLDTVIRKEGIAGLKRTVEERLARELRQLVKGIATAYADRGVPLVWMVPEFNLSDWREPVGNAPYLPEGVNREWLTHREAARAALRDGDCEAAARSAGEMVQLDHGVSAEGLYILAECSRRAGALDEARDYLERARDAFIWDTSRSFSPRVYTLTRRVLREEATKFGAEVVDVPELFKEYLEGGLPDRRLFLDYCHLSAEGIRVSMAAAAARVLRLLKAGEVAWPALVDSRVGPTPEVEAEASFLAAVHNAHWWQSSDLLHYYCLRAVRLSPAIAQVMTHFIDLQTRRVPMLMCRSAEQLAMLASPLIQHYLLRHNNQQLDVQLLDAVVSSLREAGVDAGGQLAQLRREEHSVTRGDVNLLDYYYASAAIQPQEASWVQPGDTVYSRGRRNHYYTAYSPESRFVFIGEADAPVRFRLTCRLPRLELPEGSISVEVNTTAVGELMISRDWGTWEIDVGGDAMRDGVNEVTIRWPMPAFPGEKPLEVVALSLTDRVLPEYFCPFGEIHSFVASDARPPDARLP